MSAHTFTPHPEMQTKCSVCNYLESQHGICECCPNNDILVTFKGMKMCFDCYNKEKELREIQLLGDSGKIADINSTIRTSQAIDTSVQVRTDLFNSATIAIADIKAAIDADDNITNKQLKLAEVLMERFNHFKSISFDLQEKLVEAGNHQKAIQIHLNTLANQLRQEEREKLKIADINYKPNVVKSIVTKISAPKKGFTQTQVVSAAKEAGVTIFVIQALCVSKGITPDVAVNLLKTVGLNKS